MVDFQVSNAQIFFITDAIDENLNLSTNFKALLSSCGNEHTRLFYFFLIHSNKKLSFRSLLD